MMSKDIFFVVYDEGMFYIFNENNEIIHIAEDYHALVAVVNRLVQQNDFFYVQRTHQYEND